MTLQDKPKLQVLERIDRRSHPRVNQPAAAEILIHERDGDKSFQAVLVNTSDGGMCIRHWRKDLIVGQTLRISSDAVSSTEATVIWNWSVGPVVMSGLERTEGASNRRGLLRAFPSSLGPVFDNGITSVAKQNRLRPYLLASGVGILLIAGWYFRTALWNLWSLL